MFIELKDQLPERIDQSQLQAAVDEAAGQSVALKVEWIDDKPSAIYFETPKGVNEKALAQVIREYRLPDHEPDEQQKSEAAVIELLNVLDRLAAVEARLDVLEGKKS
jgi:hypothetical protein